MHLYFKMNEKSISFTSQKGEHQVMSIYENCSVRRYARKTGMAEWSEYCRWRQSNDTNAQDLHCLLKQRINNLVFKAFIESEPGWLNWPMFVNVRNKIIVPHCCNPSINHWIEEARELRALIPSVCWRREHCFISPNTFQSSKYTCICISPYQRHNSKLMTKLLWYYALTNGLDACVWQDEWMC